MMGMVTSKFSEFFKNLKIEFKNITWPKHKVAIKNTLMIVITTIIIGGLVAALDFGIKVLINLMH